MKEEQKGCAISVMSPLHQSLTHKKLHIHVMEVDDNSDSEGKDVVSEELVVSSASEPLISVNALTGTTSFRTMRVTGYYRKKTPSYPH